MDNNLRGQVIRHTTKGVFKQVDGGVEVYRREIGSIEMCVTLL